MQEHPQPNIRPQPAKGSKAEGHAPREREEANPAKLKPRKIDRGELFRSWAYPQQH